MQFSIPLGKVEHRPITEYRLMLFTIFNYTALVQGMGGFKLQTEHEEVQELEEQIEYFRARGFKL